MINAVAQMGNSTAQKIVEYIGPSGSTQEFTVRCACLAAATLTTFGTIAGISAALNKAYEVENEMERNATSIEI